MAEDKLSSYRFVYEEFGTFSKENFDKLRSFKSNTSIQIIKQNFPEIAIFDTPNSLTKWCHFTACNVDVMHKLAKKIGLKREWFQDKLNRPHYDIKSEAIRKRALALGVILVKRSYFIRYCDAYHCSTP